MSAEELNYNNIEALIRNGANKLPVGDSKQGWEALAGQLDAAIPETPTAKPKAKFFKGFSLNMWLLIGGLFSATAIGYSLFSPSGTSDKGLDGVRIEKQFLAPESNVESVSRPQWNKPGQSSAGMMTTDNEMMEDMNEIEPGSNASSMIDSAAFVPVQGTKTDSTKKDDPFIFW